jgi:hypothetical protein
MPLVCLDELHDLSRAEPAMGKSQGNVVSAPWPCRCADSQLNKRQCAHRQVRIEAHKLHSLKLTDRTADCRFWSIEVKAPLRAARPLRSGARCAALRSSRPGGDARASPKRALCRGTVGGSRLVRAAGEKHDIGCVRLRPAGAGHGRLARDAHQHRRDVGADYEERLVLLRSGQNLRAASRLRTPGSRHVKWVSDHARSNRRLERWVRTSCRRRGP